MKVVDLWLRWLVVAGIFVLPFVPLIVAGSLYFPFITGKVFTFRIITGFVFFAWLFLAIRWPEYRPKKSWLLWSFLALIFVITLSTSFGVAPYRSVWSNYERMEGLVNYFHLFAFFLVLISVLKTRAQWYRLIAISLIANAIIVLYALLQLAGQLATHQGSRLDATLGNAAYMAVYVLVHAFLAAYLYHKTENLRDWKTPTKIVLGLLALANIFVLYYTATRGAILGFLAGALFAAFYLGFRTQGRARKWSLATLLALGILIVGFIGARQTDFVQSSPVLKRFAEISLTETTTQSRFIIWSMSLKAVAERPILGWGPENYNQVFNKYYEPILWRQEPWFDRSHNVFFDWLIIGGVLGLVLYLSLYALALFYLWRRHSPFGPYEKAILTGLLIGYFVHNIFVFDNLTSYLLFLILLGYIHFRADEHQPKAVLFEREINFGSVGNSILGLGFVIVALWASYYFSFKPLLANQELIKALRAGNDPVAYLGHMQKIVNYNTFGSNEAREQLFQTVPGMLARGDVPQAAKQNLGRFTLEQAGEHLALNPDDARAFLIVGGFLAQLNQSEAALNTLERALELSPRKQSIMFQLGTVNFNLNRLDDGLVYFKKAFELDPNYPEARSLYGLGLIYNNQSAEGVKILVDQKDEDGNKLISARTDERVLGSLIQRGMTGTARELAESAIVDAPFNPEAYFALARVEGTTGNQAGVSQALERGIAFAQSELKKDPTNRDAYNLLADLAFRSGNNNLVRQTVLAGEKNSPEFAKEADGWLQKLSAPAGQN